MTVPIFASAGVVLAIVSLIAVVWIKCVMRKPLFRPEPLEPALGSRTDNLNNQGEL
ncbi:hypothetical protein D3C76_1787630 [compost metagenome]